MINCGARRAKKYNIAHRVTQFIIGLHNCIIGLHNCIIGLHNLSSCYTIVSSGCTIVSSGTQLYHRVTPFFIGLCNCSTRLQIPRATLVPSGAGVVCRIITYKKYQLQDVSAQKCHHTEHVITIRVSDNYDYHMIINFHKEVYNNQR